VGDYGSPPAVLCDALEHKLKQFKSAERGVKIPVIAEYFGMTVLVGYLALKKGFHEFKTGNAMPISLQSDVCA
jgi:hypothetical protein